jgi:hypothetical protein
LMGVNWHSDWMSVAWVHAPVAGRLRPLSISCLINPSRAAGVRRFAMRLAWC